VELRKSLAITFSIQVYSTIITIALTPVLISMVGAEGFGLIGFFLILQTLIQILDAGISGTLSRQISVTKYCKNAFATFLRDFYKIYLGFAIVALSMFFLGLLFANSFSKNWFDSTLSDDLITFCLISMAASLAIKYFSGPLKSGLIGLELHGLVGLINFFSSTLRYPGGVLVLFLFNNSLETYFGYQVVVALLEWLALQILFYTSAKQLVQKVGVDPKIKNQGLKKLLIASLQLSVLSILWVIVSQLDKLLLSGVMPLENFGYYSLAVSVTGVVLTLNIPLSQVLMPRLSSLAGTKDKQQYIKVFINAFALAVMFFVPLSFILFFHGEELVWAWTGDKKAASEAFSYIKWLALGNLMAVFMNFSFLLQFTLKKLKKHIVAYALYSALVIPGIIYIVNQYKGEGAALFWFFHNVLFFIVWGGYSFRLYLRKFVRTILIPLIIFVIGTCYFVFEVSSYLITPFSESRLSVFIYLAAVGVFCLFLFVLLLHKFRKYFSRFVNKLSLINE